MTAARWLLLGAFALGSGRLLAAVLAGPDAIGWDARIYASAARAHLEGLDPWRAQFAA